MKYINTSTELTHEFKRLLHQYNNYYWMVAWAGDRFPLTEALSTNKQKIKKIVVGLHFYQTHPSFIEEFNSHPSVKFIKTTSGVFHSKVYLFSNSNNHWEALIGSANFTNAGFNTNNEACILINSGNNNANMYSDITNSIEKIWLQASKFTEPELEAYKISWANQKRKIDSLNGNKRSKTQETFYNIPIVKMTWKQYIDRVLRLNQDIEERIRLLEIAQEHFEKQPVFSAMPALHRKQIGGYISVGQEVNFRLFGNMNNATAFKTIVNNSPTGISRALDQIPIIGIVTKDQYNAFVKLFKEAVDGGNKYRSATRLLAMKRPDVFFGLTRANNLRLAEDFNIEGITSMNLERYWDEIVVPISESDWKIHPKPKNEMERKIAKYSAAFMDAMYYVEE